jgi:hypothetical protein
MAGWLSKIFGGGTPEPDRPDKRQSPRVDAAEMQPVALHVLLPAGESDGDVVAAQVVNISMAGCRVIGPGTARAVTAGAMFVGTLVVAGEPIPVNLELVRVSSSGEWGLRFRAPFPRELEKLKRFLEPRFLGRTLREISADVLQRGGGDMRWFQGANDTHLFSWSSGGKVAQQQLVFRDGVVEWRGAEPPRTGKLDPERSTRDAAYGRPSSDLISFDATAEAALIASARALVESSSIDETVRAAFLEKVR